MCVTQLKDIHPAESAAGFLVSGAPRGYSRRPMRGIFASLGTFIAGTLGWAIGQRLGVGTAVVLSAIGSGVGLYWGRKLFDRWLG